ncbi:MAG: hypothetical protein ACLQO7_06060 [Candidatus Bathyarchaeia archaeon]
MSLAAVPKSFSQTSDIKFANYSWYIDPEGYLDVVGLVQNTGPNTIASVSLSGTVVGPGNVDVADSGCPVWVSDLLPQQEAPFYMEFMPPNTSSSTTWYEIMQAGEFSSISLRAASANATANYQYQGLSITSSKGFVGTTGGYNGAYGVSGVIKNTGDQSASNLTVVGAFFNSTGSVVGVGFTTYLVPTILVPGNTTTFQIFCLDLNQSQVPAALQIAKYQLLVQTQGPILQGNAPVASAEPTGNTGPTDAPSSTPTAGSHAKANNSLLISIIVAVVIVVVIMAAVATIVQQVMNRNAKRRKTVKEARKVQKQKP